MWRNKDAAVEAQARASYESLPSARMRKVTVDVVASGSLGQVSPQFPMLPFMDVRLDCAVVVIHPA